MSAPERLYEKVVAVAEGLRHRRRRTAAFLAYGVVTVLAYAFAYLVRFEFDWNGDYAATFLLTLPVLVAIRHLMHFLFSLTTSRWRFVGVQDVLRLVGAAASGTVLFYAVTRLLPLSPQVPNSIIVLEGLLSVVFMAGVWIAYRVAFEATRHRRAVNGGNSGQRVLIIGAGESGYMLAREMLRSITGYRPVGFLDDDPYKWGTRLAGLEVIGSTDDLRPIARVHRVDELILAVPHATPAEMRTLVEKCASTGLQFRVLPSVAEVLKGNVRLDQIREVRIEDLLGRDPITLDLEELVEDLRGRSVLVTGAAGSIGSELSRQIARHTPGKLLLLDQAETDLFFLELELRDRHPGLEIVPIICDVVDANNIERVFEAHRPSHVFHAAAYKHVPLMEANPAQAIRNNVIGSHVIADAAGRHGSQKFVLVSTDKAVRPKSTMGASKRLAEIVTIELQDRHPTTSFAAVRFGNVLGSNGSVIPVFKRQLAEGRPLTVTHPDATRYFMTIPEAVQLILQASLLPEMRGQVAMLEMGEPVRIVDLAENLLRLSGVRKRDRIVFTGLRPGEKLHEELAAPDEETIQTPIPKVRIVRAGGQRPRGVLSRLRHWNETIATGDGEELERELDLFFPGRHSENGAEVAVEEVRGVEAVARGR